ACPLQATTQLEGIVVDDDSQRTRSDDAWDMNEIEAIRKLTDEAVVALNRGDIEASLVLQASDAQVLAPLRPAEVGSLAIRGSLESLFRQYSVRESRTLEEVEVHGEWAFTRGSYRSLLIPKDGRPAIEESGKYLEILKQDAAGAWKYYRSIWNSDG
ncbi:MAG: YybH family protein, partial [Terriglobia bacterium]